MDMEADLRKLREKVAGFAEEEIAGHSGLLSANDFPLDLWRKMGELGIMDLGFSRLGGKDGFIHCSIMTIGELLVLHGHSIGLAFSWLVHTLVARFVVIEFGSEEQHRWCCKPPANGNGIVAFAVSEPGAWPHPKNLKAFAVRQGDSYVLNGEKSFVTNGPIADLFVVLAVTGESEGRKLFSAFLIPRSSVGLSLTQPYDLGFLHPSQHCGLRLDNCTVPASAALGRQGLAYDDIARLFRDLEDIHMMGVVVGGMERQMALLPPIIRESETPVVDEIKRGFGELRSLLDAIRIPAYESARLLDRGASRQEAAHLALALRNLAGYFQSLLADFLFRSQIKPSESLKLITHDINRTLGVAKNAVAAKQKKLGEDLLSRSEANAAASKR
jgi:acyl-CoA dehydrogenase